MFARKKKQWLVIFPLLLFGFITTAQVYQFPYAGKLIIIGGGETPDSVYDFFAKEIGGKDQPFVYIPTASRDEAWIQAGKHLEKFTSRGFTAIYTLHARDQGYANSSLAIGLIKKAKGIFIGGGDQLLLAKAYNNTKVLEEMFALLIRGGVVMGTSAGASIMGSLLIGGDHRKSPHLATDFPAGFSFLPNTAIDQHVLVRNRQFDLLPILEKRPNLLGMAVDEATAAIVTRDSIRVMGNSYVLLYDQQDWQRQQKEWGRVYRPFKMYRSGEIIKSMNQ